MASELLDAMKELETLVKGKDGFKINRGHELKMLHANIQEAEAMYLMRMQRGSPKWTDMLAKFLELKEFVYEVEEHLDKLRIEALISQERGNDLIARVSSMNLRRLGSHPQPEPNEQRNTHLMNRAYNKVCDFFLSCSHGLNFNDLESKLTTNFSWTNDGLPSGHFTATGISKCPGVPKVVGRDEDKISIINLLESSDPAVISIVGPVGIGKSTLAKFVICHDKVRELFPIKKWAVVSDHEDLGGIAKALLISDHEDLGDDPVQFLEEVVCKNKSLLVLDDLRFLDIKKMGELKNFLDRIGLRGSRTLVTTRNEKVARQLGTSLPYFLQPLSMDACWLLCPTIARSPNRGNESSNEHNQNETLFMEQIFQRSGGLPLFAKAWGEILHLKFTEGGWKSILDGEIWNADVYVYDDLLRRVESNYSSLPKHLKLCFKYFSLIPKGYWIEKEVLSQLWMAEGFTNPEEEETAEKCFDELLLETCMFKDIEKDEDGNIVRCKIHEPLHDIICHLSQDEFSVITGGLPLQPHSLHSSLCCINNMPNMDSNNAKKVHTRTLLCFGCPGNLKVLSDLSSSHFKLLRVLDLSFFIIEELPDSIAKLEHLRYLNLSYTQIKKLPPFICKLYLLQTLKLSHSLVIELPRKIWKLQKLRHLEIDGTPMNHLPPGIWRLRNILQKLSEFIVSDSGYSIEELADLEHLQGKLIISHLNRVPKQEVTQAAKLNTKKGIKHLILDGKKHLSSRNLQQKRLFSSLLLEHMCNEVKFISDDESKRVEGVFEGINPHSDLKRLEIWNYFGSKLPTWLAASHRGLVSLKLAKWLKMDHMPHLGSLQSLKFLHICGMDKVKSIETCDLKGFPKLEQLTLEEMLEWEEWKLELSEGDLPCFFELILSNCPKLKNLPALPETLRKLEIHDCKETDWKNLSPPLLTLEYLLLKGKVSKLCSLPNAPRLVSLTIALSPEMTSFPNGVNKLESLSALNIYFCPRLHSLPEELKQLNNLKRLHIAGCQLEAWLKKNKEILKKIPKVEMDNKVLPSGCSYDDDDNHDGKGDDYDYGDSGYGKEGAYDDDSISKPQFSCCELANLVIQTRMLLQRFFIFVSSCLVFPSRSRTERLSSQPHREFVIFFFLFVDAQSNLVRSFCSLEVYRF
ncbi:hypothetical protein NE237_009687 [Protea cynaroides]|uniref:AAA+ ATPase domain-containing protein n=1 Tax=Protea cynaroides TaxID=273540 RepID=A0A9Q0KXW2_9MAGN|nr:hypothetical protein NE237_009687 [Protea cynaroides]